MIIARPLVVGVEEVHRTPVAIHRWPPCLRHATGLRAPFGPRTLPCLTLGGLWPPPKWAASWICPTRKQASARWSEKPQCSAARHNVALELLLKRPHHWQNSDDCDEQRERSAAPEASATASTDRVDEPAPEPCAEEAFGQQSSAAPLSSDAASGSREPAEGQRQQPEEPVTFYIGSELEEQQQLPDGLVQTLEREDSDWSFLSNSVHTVESVELNEDQDTSEDDRLPQAPRWRRMRDFFWSPQAHSGSSP
jgi:hypothetical protein